MTSHGRIFPNSTYVTIKAAMRRLVQAAGGQESAASICRVDHQRLSKYGRVGDVTHAPLDVVADLERDTGLPMVTRVLADLQGYVLVEKPVVEGYGDWIRDFAALGKEAGDALSRIGDALSGDGTITAEESRSLELRREIAELMTVLAQIDVRLVVLERDDAGDE